MKIGMLVDTYLPIIGGAEIHVLELSRALRALGYEIEICTATPGGRAKPPGEFPLSRIPRLTGGRWKALLNIPLALPELVQFVRRVDFIHCHYSFLLAALGTILGRLFGKRTAVTLHGLGTLDSSANRSVLFRLYRFLSIRLASVVIATSDEMRDVALRFTRPEKIVVIPNGVDTARFIPRPRPRTSQLVILSMRRLAPKNGVQYLVEAAPRVLKSLPQARFWIAGEGKLESHIRQRVIELGIQKQVRFIGIVPHEDTPAYYQQADIVVFPSSAESTSLACLEAMSMQKAVVASSLAVYQEMLGKNGERGILAELFDSQASNYNAPLNLPAERIQVLAQAILRLAKNAALRRRLGQAARRFVITCYDWQVVAKQTARLYQKP